MNLINNLRGDHCFVLSRMRRITGGKITTLNWPIQIFTATYDGAYSPNVSVRMARISFGALPCRKKRLMTARFSMLLKSRASLHMLPFNLCNNSAHERAPLSNDTIDSFLRHRKIGRAKDLSSPFRMHYLLRYHTHDSSAPGSKTDCSLALGFPNSYGSTFIPPTYSYCFRLAKILNIITS